MVKRTRATIPSVLITSRNPGSETLLKFTGPNSREVTRTAIASGKTNAREKNVLVINR